MTEPRGEDLSEGKGMTFLPTNVARPIDVGGMPPAPRRRLETEVLMGDCPTRSELTRDLHRLREAVGRALREHQLGLVLDSTWDDLEGAMDSDA